MFPLEKYTYIVKGKIVKALQTYAGEVYAGIAHCAPEDEFDFEKGKELAAARCNEKISKARVAYARKKYLEALKVLKRAQKEFDKYGSFMCDASVALDTAICDKESIENELGVVFDGVED